MDELILRVNGSYPMKFIWGGICGNERIGGLTIMVGKLCHLDTPIESMKFGAGGVMNRKNARKLMKLIKEGLTCKKGRKHV